MLRLSSFKTGALLSWGASVLLFLGTCFSARVHAAPVPVSGTATQEATHDVSLIGGERSLLDLDFDFGPPLSGSDKSMQLQGRIGVLLIHGAWYRSFGLRTKMLGPISGAALLEAEVLQLEHGLWAQCGAGMSFRGHPVVSGALGFSLFGLELMREFSSGSSFQLVGKFRVPLTILSQVF